MPIKIRFDASFFDIFDNTYESQDDYPYQTYASHFFCIDMHESADILLQIHATYHSSSLQLQPILTKAHEALVRVGCY